MLTGCPASLRSASITSSVAPLSNTRLPGANWVMSSWVYSRLTVPGVANKPMQSLRVRAAAGLMAGTTPTTGMLRVARRDGRAMVLAVLQAITTRSMACAATMWLTKPVQAEISSGSLSSP
ncbi:hypothetical protein D3C77_674410 [compost metagenome]